MTRMMCEAETGKVGWGGDTFEIRSGIVDVPPQAVPDLKCHGFIWIDDPDYRPAEPAKEAPPAPPDYVAAMDRKVLFATLKALGVDAEPATKDETLRKMLREKLAPPEPAKPAA